MIKRIRTRRLSIKNSLPLAGVGLVEVCCRGLLPSCSAISHHPLLRQTHCNVPVRAPCLPPPHHTTPHTTTQYHKTTTQHNTTKPATPHNTTQYHQTPTHTSATAASERLPPPYHRLTHFEGGVTWQGWGWSRCAAAASCPASSPSAGIHSHLN